MKIPGQILPCLIIQPAGLTSLEVSGTDPPVLDHSACWAVFFSLSTYFLAYCMLVFQHVRAGMSAGSRCVSELKPHRVILYEKAKYVKMVHERRSQKTVGAGEHRSDCDRSG